MVMKELLYYVRILVEVLIDDEFFEEIFFENEWSGIKNYMVYDEWKLVKCK